MSFRLLSWESGGICGAIAVEIRKEVEAQIF
ncbi:hypothetical protein NIES2109_00480 [Nostoc sp. HK-01]|nr:hypothetical protein NIES2109_00480 [Nostoc sp. HK-01]